MNNSKSLKNDLLAILEIARLAPSVHNAQPWKVKNINNSLSVEIDKAYSLKYSDPTGREIIISLGIFCEAIALAARSIGWELKESQLQHKAVELNFMPTKSNTAKAVLTDIKSLKNRCSDRSIYKPLSISDANFKHIKDTVNLPGVSVWTVKDSSFIQKVSELTAKGIGLALSSPDFRQELSKYLTLPWFNRRGISVLSLNLPFPLAILEPKLIRWGIGSKKEVEMERKRWLSASGIILITTKGDVDKDWYAAGRAYLKVSLVAEQLGFAQATSAAIVEASTFHEDIEELLGTKERLQAVIRIGNSTSKKIHSPRVTAEELLATSNLELY